MRGKRQEAPEPLPPKGSGTSTGFPAKWSLMPGSWTVVQSLYAAISSTYQDSVGNAQIVSRVRGKYPPGGGSTANVFL